MSGKSKILMIYTGGTIGMVKDPISQSLIPFQFSQLLNKIPELSELSCQIDTDSLEEPIDSSNIKPEHWVRIAKRIEQDYDKYEGFVILHGSDTMAYTSSALSFMLKNLSKPVILTGSQLPIGLARSDARENLLTAIEIAIARREDGLPQVPEVAIYFEYDLFRGNRVHKVSSEDFEAFQSLNYPKLAEAGVNIKYNSGAIRHPSKDPLKLQTNLSTNVAVISCFPGMTQSYFDSIINHSEAEVFILRTFGSGNAPTDLWFLDAIKKSIKQGKHFINASQCEGGAVSLGKYEASQKMQEMGMISAKDMSLEAVVTKSMFLLGQSLSALEFKESFEKNLEGEVDDKLV